MGELLTFYWDSLFGPYEKSLHFRCLVGWRTELRLWRPFEALSSALLWVLFWAPVVMGSVAQGPLPEAQVISYNHPSGPNSAFVPVWGSLQGI